MLRSSGGRRPARRRSCSCRGRPDAVPPAHSSARCSSASGGGGLRISGRFIGERLLEIRVVHGEQRTRAQLADEQEHPQRGQADRDRDVHPVHRRNAVATCRASAAPCLNDGATYQIISTSRITSTQAATLARVPLRFFSPADSSRANGRKKCPTTSAMATQPQGPRDARDVPRDLFRQVARPDDQELREGQVRPQHHEREQQLAEVVEMARRQQRCPRA